MPLPENQLAKIRQKEESLADSLKRDACTNYREGWFFVTLNTRDGVPVLSSCVGDARVADGLPDAPRCVYTELGRAVIEAWRRMPEVCNTVEIGPCEAMPEHFHGLVHLLPGNQRHLGSLISGFMSGCTHAYWDMLGIEWRAGRQAMVDAKKRGDVAYARLHPDRDKDHTRSLRGPALFVRGYNDVEALTPEQVQVKRDYIRDQARKRVIQGDRHPCFRKHWHQRSRNWTMERAVGAVGADRFFHNNAEKCLLAQQHVRERLNDGLDYLGARSIMAAEWKLPLICHRADAALFDRQCEAVLQAAREGAVVVSAFISPKEREIREQLMRERLPIVEILDNGISERYKPTGRAFYAVAENRLVQISCWRYQYQKEGNAVSREMCLVMNELARVICGAKEDWWKR